MEKRLYTLEVIVAKMLDTIKELENTISIVNNSVIDKSTTSTKAIGANINDISDTQNATCELSKEIDARITDVEIALCELSEQ